MTSTENAQDFQNSAAFPQLLTAVCQMVARANSGGGIVTLPDIQTIGSLRASQLTATDVESLVSNFAGPGRIRIRKIIRVPGNSGEVNAFVQRTEPLPLVLTTDLAISDHRSDQYKSGDILVWKDGRVQRSDYDDTVAIVEAAAKNLYKPDSAATLLDVTLARRARNSSALLDRMDLLWCLVERGSIDLTTDRLSLLVRSSLRRTPTLFFWLAELTDQDLIEEILVSSLDDEDRDSSDAKDSILEVGALMASDNCLSKILDKMRRSQYSHFREAAAEWAGRQREVNAFVDRLSIIQIDEVLIADWPVEALYNRAVEMASEAIVNGISPRRISDIGRAVFSLRQPNRLAT